MWAPNALLNCGLILQADPKSGEHSQDNRKQVDGSYGHVAVAQWVNALISTPPPRDLAKARHIRRRQCSSGMQQSESPTSLGARLRARDTNMAPLDHWSLPDRTSQRVLALMPNAEATCGTPRSTSTVSRVAGSSPFTPLGIIENDQPTWPTERSEKVQIHEYLVEAMTPIDLRRARRAERLTDRPRTVACVSDRVHGDLPRRPVPCRYGP